MKYKVGFIGWRGMVGSVLLNRMKEENDFEKIDPFFFTTSQIGKKGPYLKNGKISILYDAYDIDFLKELHIIITCQGAEYTKCVYKKLKKINWQGFWIDSSSLLRTDSNSIIILDPINYDSIVKGLNQGIKTFVGGNCTVSLMLLALGGLFQHNLIEWISVSTYQAISGAGSQQLKELLLQMEYFVNIFQKQKNKSILELESLIFKACNNKNFPKNFLKFPLVNNLLPWIDSIQKNGQSKEEWKGMFETNKILNSVQNIPIDGTCVRISSLRCHSQSFTIKLKKDISINNIKLLIKHNNPWVRIISNTPQETMNFLNPISVSGTLNIPIGRIRKLNFGSLYCSAFTVGDQLLWGASEPLRRMLNILISL
ncbi:aspartate-semialdehyde dehydrogenase [Buchnera aphidicola]|uniref:aspartate-semialdehyde dehydrogenase n=1 Tax=Buchnera aphidicola TaxID=9 RepID=UPI003CCACD98